MRPILERAFGSSGHHRIRATPILEAVALHASLGESRGVQELLATMRPLRNNDEMAYKKSAGYGSGWIHR
jgi:hypothetical protein